MDGSHGAFSLVGYFCNLSDRFVLFYGSSSTILSQQSVKGRMKQKGLVVSSFFSLNLLLVVMWYGMQTLNPSQGHYDASSP
jgi:hypothetical protein